MYCGGGRGGGGGGRSVGRSTAVNAFFSDETIMHYVSFSTTGA